MAARMIVERDECGREDVVGCIGGTHYYCTRHEDQVAEMHAKDALGKEE